MHALPCVNCFFRTALYIFRSHTSRCFIRRVNCPPSTAMAQIDPILSSILALMTLVTDNEAGRDALSIAKQLLPHSILVECGEQERRDRWMVALQAAVASSQAAPVVAVLRAHQTDPKEATNEAARVSPLGCGIHPADAIKSAANAATVVSEWFYPAAAAKFMGNSLMSILVEPELLWETPYAGKGVSPADAVELLLSSLACSSCRYAGFVEHELANCPDTAETDDRRELELSVPSRVEVRSGTAPVCNLLVVSQTSLLPHALLRALATSSLRPVTVASAPERMATGGAYSINELLINAIIPVHTGGPSGDGDRGRFTVDLWARLAPEEAAPADVPSVLPTDGAINPAVPAATSRRGWGKLAGYSELRVALEESVVVPIAAARVSAVRISASPDSPEAALARLASAMRSLRVDPPRGLLLHGPTGCGKTAWATALAQAAGLRLLHIACPRLPSRYVGDSEAAVRAVFRAARAAAPCLLLLDDIHTIAAARAGGSGGPAYAQPHVDDGKDVDDEGENISECGSRSDTDSDEAASQDGSSGLHHPHQDERLPSSSEADGGAFVSHLPDGLAGTSGGGASSVLDRMLATLLNEMDGVGLRKTEGGGGGPNGAVGAGVGKAGPLDGFVLVVGTTDTPGRLDPAVTRPGRLERHLLIGPVSRAEDALALLQLATRSMALADDVDLPSIALELLQAKAGSGARSVLTPADISHGAVSAALAALQEATGTSYDHFAKTAVSGSQGNSSTSATASSSAGRTGPSSAAPSKEDGEGLQFLRVTARHLRAALGVPIPA